MVDMEADEVTDMVVVMVVDMVDKVADEVAYLAYLEKGHFHNFCYFLFCNCEVGNWAILEHKKDPTNSLSRFFSTCGRGFLSTSSHWAGSASSNLFQSLLPERFLGESCSRMELELKTTKLNLRIILKSTNMNLPTVSVIQNEMNSSPY